MYLNFSVYCNCKLKDFIKFSTSVIEFPALLLAPRTQRISEEMFFVL